MGGFNRHSFNPLYPPVLGDFKRWGDTPQTPEGTIQAEECAVGVLPGKAGLG